MEFCEGSIMDDWTIICQFLHLSCVLYQLQSIQTTHTYKGKYAFCVSMHYTKHI